MAKVRLCMKTKIGFSELLLFFVGGALNYTDCKNIIKHFLQILPIAGNNYVAVFKLIQDFFSASTSLLPADVLLLGKQLEALVGQEIQTKDEESSEEKSKFTYSRI